MIKYLSLNICVEIATCFIAFICLNKDKDIAWWLVAIFMLFTCIVELTGRALGLNNKSNYWVYNIYLIAEAGFVTTMYRHLFIRYTKKVNFIGAGVLLLTVLYLYEIASHGFFVYNDKTETVMLVLFICYGLYYYYLFINDTDYVQLFIHPPFWWVAGTLFFFYGSIVCVLFYTFLDANTWKLFTERHIIYTYLNFILYGFWSYSFICRYQQRKSIA